MTSPAQVSGPGRFSRRTDVGGQPIRELPDAKYGEAKAFREAQKAAPLAQSEAVSAAPPPSEVAATAERRAPAAPRRQLPGLFDRGDSNVPMTSGAPVGAGPNTIRGLPAGTGAEFNPTALRDALQPYVAADPSGVLRDTIQALAERGLW